MSRNTSGNGRAVHWLAAGLAFSVPLMGLPVSTAAAQTDPPAVVATSPSALSARLDTVLDRAVADQRLVGTVVIVMQNGEIVYRRAAGFADREAGLPMRPDTVFRLASVSKPYVTAVALRLVQEGQLSIDDPVTKWIPDFQPEHPGSAVAPVITIRQLLTHTAGLAYGTDEVSKGPYSALGVSTGGDAIDVTLTENVRRLGEAPLLQAPGTAWIYSLSIDVLGLVIERVTGERLQVAVDRLLIDPLGLKDTGFYAPDPERLAVAYANGEAGPVRIREGVPLPLGPIQVALSPARALNRDAYPSGGAGMVGTADDFARFAEALRTGDQDFLTSTTTAEMFKDQAVIDAQAQGPGWGFGYGGAVLVDPVAAGSPMSLGTLQWSGAYGSNWFIDPALGLVVVALTNTAFEGMSGQFPTDIRDAVYQETGLTAAQSALTTTD